MTWPSLDPPVSELLPWPGRVTALKVLCELRLERADIRNRLEAAEIMRHNRRKVSHPVT